MIFLQIFKENGDNNVAFLCFWRFCGVIVFRTSIQVKLLVSWAEHRFLGHVDLITWRSRPIKGAVKVLLLLILFREVSCT